jgi:hypothetical protein
MEKKRERERERKIKEGKDKNTKAILNCFFTRRRI